MNKITKRKDGDLKNKDSVFWKQFWQNGKSNRKKFIDELIASESTCSEWTVFDKQWRYRIVKFKNNISGVASLYEFQTRQRRFIWRRWVTVAVTETFETGKFITENTLLHGTN